MCLVSAEEPFLIMADHHEIRKLSVDGSNYTILKQVTVSVLNIHRSEDEIQLFVNLTITYRPIFEHYVA